MSFPGAWGGLVLRVCFFINSFFLYPVTVAVLLFEFRAQRVDVHLSVLEQVWDASSQSAVCRHVILFSSPPRHFSDRPSFLLGNKKTKFHSL